MIRVKKKKTELQIAYILIYVKINTKLLMLLISFTEK